MIEIDAQSMSYRNLNAVLRENDEAVITNCYGERFIASGMKDKKIVIKGTPGNALGSYLNGSELEVYGNAEEAVGDTMNDGLIVVHGNVGDCLGYAMRGGEIYVEGNAGYRAGVHIKQYGEKRPVIVIGGTAGSFLGEYQAGGIIIVLGRGTKNLPYGNFVSTGIHGGKLLIRSCVRPTANDKVKITKADDGMLQEFMPYIEKYKKLFGVNDLDEGDYYVLTPDESNPYKRLYTAN